MESVADILHNVHFAKSSFDQLPLATLGREISLTPTIGRSEFCTYIYTYICLYVYVIGWVWGQDIRAALGRRSVSLLFSLHASSVAVQVGHKQGTYTYTGRKPLTGVHIMNLARTPQPPCRCRFGIFTHPPYYSSVDLFINTWGGLSMKR